MRRIAAVAGALVFGSALSVAAAGVGTGVAGAAPGYPPPPPTTGSGSITVTIGQSTSFTACGFAPGSVVHISRGGGTATAGANGCVTVSVRVGSGPTLSINGGPFTGARCGPNLVILDGTNPAGRPFHFTETVNINCGVSPAAVTKPAAPSAAKPSAAAAARPAAAAAAAPSSGLAFTGADIAYTTIGGLLLIAAGGALWIVVSRRKKTA